MTIIRFTFGFVLAVSLFYLFCGCAHATPRRTQLTTGGRPRNQSPAGGMTNAMKRLVAGVLFTVLQLAAAP